MLKSLVHTENPFCSTQDIHQWILRRNQEVHVSVEEIPFAEMEGWHMAEDGSLHHQSGKFFSIEGIHVFPDFPKPYEQRELPPESTDGTGRRLGF